MARACYSNCEGEAFLAGDEKEGAKTRFGRNAVVAAGSVSETSSSPRIYATLSMRRRSESGHLWRATSCARQEKIEDFHFHDVRHTFVTILLQSGLDLYKVQQLLGHKSSTMTQRYAHHYLESLRNEVEVLDRTRGARENLAQPAGLKEGLNCVSDWK